MSIISTKGTLDWAYPPFILASTTAALGYEVDVFGFSRDEFIPEVAGWVGAASFLPMAQKSDITLFI